MVEIYSSSFGNMVKSYLKEEGRIAEKIQKFSCLYDKGNTKDIKKIRKKMRDVNFLF